MRNASHHSTTSSTVQLSDSLLELAHLALSIDLQLMRMAIEQSRASHIGMAAWGLLPVLGVQVTKGTL
jgi:hypothetical protein